MTANHPDDTPFDSSSEFDAAMYYAIYNADSEQVLKLDRGESSGLSKKQFIPSYTSSQKPTKKRSRLERWFGRHNHKMEFLRTFFAFITVTLQVVILSKLFGVF